VEKCVPSLDCLYQIRAEPGKMFSITLQNLSSYQCTWYLAGIYVTRCVSAEVPVKGRGHLGNSHPKFWIPSSLAFITFTSFIHR